MIKTQISNKQELLKAIQSATIKKIIADDIDDKTDLQKIVKQADDQLRSNDQMTMLLIMTKSSG
jgi:hypothetical protein